MPIACGAGPLPRGYCLWWCPPCPSLVDCLWWCPPFLSYCLWWWSPLLAYCLWRCPPRPLHLLIACGPLFIACGGPLPLPIACGGGPCAFVCFCFFELLLSLFFLFLYPPSLAYRLWRWSFSLAYCCGGPLPSLIACGGAPSLAYCSWWWPLRLCLRLFLPNTPLTLLFLFPRSPAPCFLLVVAPFPCLLLVVVALVPVLAAASSTYSSHSSSSSSSIVYTYII